MRFNPEQQKRAESARRRLASADGADAAFELEHIGEEGSHDDLAAVEAAVEAADEIGLEIYSAVCELSCLASELRRGSGR